MARICLSTRERPGVGGGIGVSVPAVAACLADEHDVVLITEAGDDLPPAPAGVRRVTVRAEVDWAGAGFRCPSEAWSAAVLRGMEEAYGGEEGPDLYEAPDYCAEAVVPLRAARRGHPLLGRTRIAVRLRGTAEVTMLLNKWWPTDEPGLALYDLEREALAGADAILTMGGDVVASYRRYYGPGSVAPAHVVRVPFPALPPATDPAPRSRSEPPLLVFLGRLEMRKGVIELAEALRSRPDLRCRVALVGSDTSTAPGGGSMRAWLEGILDGDVRVDFVDRVPRDAAVELLAGADLAVFPSRFDWWANVAQEAMAVGTPVLATPKGGFVEQVVPGTSGWLTDGTGTPGLVRALDDLLTDPTPLAELRRRGAGRRHLRRLTDPATVLRGYRELLQAGARGD